MTPSPEQLLIDYHKMPSDTGKQALVIAYKNLVAYIAKKMTYHYDDLEDLIQVGSIGLLKAIDRFDPTRKVEFVSFATPTIIGEIKHYFRDAKQLIKIPRKLQEMTHKIKSFMTQFTQDHHTSPTVKQIADALNLDIDDVLEALDASKQTQIMSLDLPKYSQSDAQPTTLMDHISAKTDHDELDIQALKHALQQLDEREQTVLHYRYMHGMTQAEIATQLSLSQMHISRLIKDSLSKLRSLLEKQP